MRSVNCSSMVSDEWVRRAVQARKSYEDLPGRVRNSITLSEWKAKVKEYCIDQGYGWSDNMASTSCGEQEYYEDLLAYYKTRERVFPYHLADYVCRVLRVTPFQYYSDILFACLRNESAYDKIPNFTAADALRLLGVGRNEYIAILDSLRAKKLLWRVNKNIAKEKLPVEPLSFPIEPWWKIGVVNITELEFRTLNAQELELLHTACNGIGLEVRKINLDSLRSLYNRGLLYLRIPVKESNRFTIPPLEGFVSNRNSATEGVDPMETLLYSVFVANSESIGIGNLARVLNVDAREVRGAMSFACRLGFASRISTETSQDDAVSYESYPLPDEGEDVKPAKEADKPVELPAEESGQAVALVVNAEVTSYLMMGALSPGVKRHAVTLFEGGKVAGEEVIADLISELKSSISSDIKHEGEIMHLTNHASALAMVLECIKGASGGRSPELLRIESLSELAPGAIQRVLSHSYKVVLPVAPLPGVPLPLTSSPGSLVSFGPDPPLASLWCLLALYERLGQGPVSVVFLRGQRVHELPACLSGHKTLALRLWGPITQPPFIVSQPFLLTFLNELLRKDPILVQPLCPTILDSNGKLKEECLVDVPLPLEVQEKEGQNCIKGFNRSSGDEVFVNFPSTLEDSLKDLGFAGTLGFLRMVHANHLGYLTNDVWVPTELHVGMPIHNIGLCRSVCDAANTKMLLDNEHQNMHISNQAIQKIAMEALMLRYGGSWGQRKGAHATAVALPATNFMFDGEKLTDASFSNCFQGSDMVIRGGVKFVRSP